MLPHRLCQIQHPNAEESEVERPGVPHLPCGGSILNVPPKPRGCSLPLGGEGMEVAGAAGPGHTLGFPNRKAITTPHCIKY